MKQARQGIKQLESLRNDWFEVFGYEKDINERINFEIDKLKEYFCDVCGTTTADGKLNCINCGAWLGAEE